MKTCPFDRIMKPSDAGAYGEAVYAHHKGFYLTAIRCAASLGVHRALHLAAFWLRLRSCDECSSVVADMIEIDAFDA